MDYDGGNKQNISMSTSYDQFPQFSPDGSFIIYQGWEKGKMEILFTNIIDKNRINLTKNVNYNDIISPW
jgi:Periplasmic component of the Tol biopolymer transport system